MLQAMKTANASEQELWHRIEQHDFEPPHPLNFTRRFARDHGLSLDETRLAISGYKRFCFLAIISTTQMTPSELVDEVWHQHLTYSRDYWDIWCGQVLQKPLHHDPTPGGPAAQQHYRECYARTLALYEQFFGFPDVRLWPATHIRFGRRPRYRVIDTTRLITLPRAKHILRRTLFKES